MLDFALTTNFTVQKDMKRLQFAPTTEQFELAKDGAVACQNLILITKQVLSILMPEGY